MHHPFPPDRVLPVLGIGFYSAPEAARLLGVDTRSVRRWLGGYTYRRKGDVCAMPPLWTPQLAGDKSGLELGFRDLIELRFVNAFLKAGLGLAAVRRCLDLARASVNDERPFSTRRFRTDGHTIYLDSLMSEGRHEMLDLRDGQMVMRTVLERTFKDLDIEDGIVARWWPHRGRKTIVIDPMRAFGQPVAAATGVPTLVLAQALAAEGTVERVARLYDVELTAVRDALSFEQSLH